MQFKIPNHWRRHTITYNNNGRLHTIIVHTLKDANRLKARLDNDPDVDDIRIRPHRRND